MPLSLSTAAHRTHPHGSIRHTARRGLLVLAGLLILSSAAFAQTHTYASVEVPFPHSYMRITGLTDLGKLVGSYTDASHTERVWRLTPPNRWEKITWKGQPLWIVDVAGSGRMVGGYGDAAGWHPFTLHSGRLKELEAPGLSVGLCAINNDASLIVCTAQREWEETSRWRPRRSISTSTARSWGA